MILFIKRLFIFLLFFSTAINSINIVKYIKHEKYNLEINWHSYYLNINGFIPLDQQLIEAQRKQIRETTKEKILARTTVFFENFNIDSNYKIKDLLAVNRVFSLEYSLFLDQLRISSLFFKYNGIETSMMVALRGDKGLLSRLPLPWSEEKYSILQAEEYLGQGYQRKKASGEFFQSLAPVDYTGLLINARDLELTPAFAPRIYSQDGRLIYGPEYISRSVGINRGIVAYVTDFKDPEVLHRVGKNFLLTSALTTKGKHRTDLVISHEDTEKLFDSRVSAENLLKCRVVVLVHK